MHYFLQSPLAGYFLLLELTLQQETHIYTNLHNLQAMFVLFLSSIDNTFILIGQSKQCVQSRRTRRVLKIERYAQRLSHRACMGDATLYSWVTHKMRMIKYGYKYSIGLPSLSLFPQS